MTDRREVIIPGHPNYYSNPVRVVRIGEMVKIEQLDERKRVLEDVRLDITEVASLIHALEELMKVKL